MLKGDAIHKLVTIKLVTLLGSLVGVEAGNSLQNSCLQQFVQPKYHGISKLQPSLFIKVECVFPMIVVSMLPHAEFVLNDHRETAPHFTHKFCI